MDNIPTEILVGVNPLLFAVDVPEEDETKEVYNNTKTANTRPRSPFEKFLDAVARNATVNSDAKLASFFTRARIETVGAQHVFPPSNNNNNNNLSPSLEERASQGILPSGWLEKHSHALPSCVLVVATLAVSHLLEYETYEEQQQQHASSSSSSSAAEQFSSSSRDRMMHVIDVLKRLKTTLIGSSSKRRECKVVLVALIVDNHNNQEDDDVVVNPDFYSTDNRFLLTIKQEVQLTSSGLIGIPMSQLEGGGDLSALLRNVMETSSSYYLSEARRAKRKLSLLSPSYSTGSYFPNMGGGGGGSASSSGAGDQQLRVNINDYSLLSLYVRYNFKIATMYDFIGNKTEKSFKHYQDAYAALELYYHYLLEMGKSKKKSNSSKILEGGYHQENNTEEGAAEVEVINNSFEAESSEDPPSSLREISSDILFQCLEVASWLNLKILRMALSPSNTNTGKVSSKDVQSACDQWRRHCRAFLNKNFQETVVAKQLQKQPKWHHLLYVSNQRIIMAQILERAPDLLSHIFDNNIDIASSTYCSVWKQYLSAAESLCKFYYEIQKQRPKIQGLQNEHSLPLSQKAFVGEIGRVGLSPLFNKEYESHNFDKALVFCRKALVFYEKEDNFCIENDKTISNLRTYARLRFLCAQLLMRQNNWSEAIEHLNDIKSTVSKWPGIHYSVMNAIEKCYLEQNQIQEAQKVSAAILFSSYSDLLSRQQTERIYGSIVSTKKTGDLDFELSKLSPLSFSVYFPDGVAAEAGDEVTVSVLFRSQISVPLYIKAAKVHFGFNESNCPIMDDVKVLLPGSKVCLTAKLRLPALQNIDASNTGFVRLRPNSSGLSHSGGGVLSMRSEAEGSQARKLLGFPVGCVCVRVTLYNPIDSSTREVQLYPPGRNQLDVVDEQDFYRVPQPESKSMLHRLSEDYIHYAWTSSFVTRSIDFGPQCLRIMNPLSLLKVTNLTANVTDSIAIDGSIYRSILKIQAGAREWCKNICINVRASCNLGEQNVDTKDAVEENGYSEDQNGSVSRPSYIVLSDEAIKNPIRNVDGYEIPAGWRVLDQNCSDSSTSLPVIDILQPNEIAYVSFDLYRPPSKSPLDPVVNDSDCATHFEVDFTYLQSKANSLSKSGMEGKMTIRQYSGSIVWKQVVGAKFDVNSTQWSKSGSEEVSSASKNSSVIFPKFHLGETVPISCSLNSKLADSEYFNHDVIVNSISFQGGDENNNCALPFQHCYEVAGVKTYAHQLRPKTTLDVNFTVEVKKGRLGVMNVCWTPKPLGLNSDVTTVKSIHSIDEYSATLHGALPIASFTKFFCPEVQVTQPSLKVTISSMPSSAKLSIPFIVSFQITNVSPVHDVLHIYFEEPNTNEFKAAFYSGFLQESTGIAPSETKYLSYTVVPVLAGKMELPKLKLYSSLQQTWLSSNSYQIPQHIFVEPI